MFGRAAEHQHAGRSPLEVGPGELGLDAEDRPIVELPVVTPLYPTQEPVGLDLGNGNREAAGGEHLRANTWEHFTGSGAGRSFLGRAQAPPRCAPT